MATKFFAEVFERDNHRCVYCGRDLMVDFETFMITEEDHLVPLSREGENAANNIVIACAVCNRLKSSFIPKIQLTEKSRVKYIDEIRHHVMNRRSEKMKDYASWTHSTSSKK